MTGTLRTAENPQKCPEEGCAIPLAAHDCCGSEAPNEMTDDQGRVWVSGDCWCTLDPHHDPEKKHVCAPCSERYGAPGWYDHDQRTKLP